MFGAPASYVGSKVCAGCHKQIYSNYVKTDMGRSIAFDLSGSPAAPVTIRNPKINRLFDVRATRDGLYESEYAVDANGSEIFRTEEKMEYSVGAGRNGTSYLVRRKGLLFEAPLSYYTQTATWEMSPGFESLDLAFNRPVLPGCLDCHTGAAPTSRSAEIGGSTQVSPGLQAIGCENCHGPGSLHAAERGEGRSAKGNLDTLIVNPAKLPLWLADNICMACHQGRALRVRQPGRRFTDFQPGQPLNNTIAIFATPLPDKPSSASLSPLLEHYTLMSLSRCYTGSQGRLGCVTCHDPHVQPQAEPVSFFRQKCLGCHQESSCKLPVGTRKIRSRFDSCVECHMPKAPVNGIAHSVLTSHRIVRTEDEPFPTALLNSSKPMHYGLIHLNAEPGKPDHLPDLTAFRAYTELASANAAYAPQYLDLLQIVSKENPDEPDVLSAMGWLKLGNGPEHDATQAINYLTKAIDRGSVRLEDYQALADLLSKNGQSSDAERVLNKGIQIAPYDERMYKQLAFIYMSSKRYPEALAAMRQIVTLFPEDDFMRALLQKVEPQKGTP